MRAHARSLGINPGPIFHVAKQVQTFGVDPAGGIDWAGLDRLVDWYLERGAKGLFAVCGSSELDALTLDERFALCERVAARAAPHPVVASGTFGGPLPLQAGDCRRMVEAGARAAVILTGNLAVGEESDDTWRARLGELMDLTAPIPLGFYERPGPNNRAIPPGTLGELAVTSRSSHGRVRMPRSSSSARSRFSARSRSSSSSSPMSSGQP